MLLEIRCVPQSDKRLFKGAMPLMDNNALKTRMGIASVKFDVYMKRRKVECTIIGCRAEW